MTSSSSYVLCGSISVVPLGFMECSQEQIRIMDGAGEGPPQGPGPDPKAGVGGGERVLPEAPALGVWLPEAPWLALKGLDSSCVPLSTWLRRLLVVAHVVVHPTFSPLPE